VKSVTSFCSVDEVFIFQYFIHRTLDRDPRRATDETLLERFFLQQVTLSNFVLLRHAVEIPSYTLVVLLMTKTFFV
jgi:hypothetical protein